MDETEVAVAPEISTPAVEDQQASEEVKAPIPEQESIQERNWREARQTLKQLRHENRELARRMEEMQRAKEQPKETPVAEDDIVTEKRLNRRIQELEMTLKQREEQDALERLQLKYADFDEVVNEESIEFLKTNDPELADSLSKQPDPYKRAIAAYKMLKRSDYFQQKETMKEKAKIVENAQKPVSANAVRKQGALAEANRFANGLTPELKKALMREMAEASKRS